jgi:acylaminoacyl-peptidase
MIRQLAFAGLTLLAAVAAQARTLTPHDLVMLDRVSDPHLSPDGRLVAYDVRSTDYDANKGRHAIWLVCPDCRTGAPWRLAASDGGATAPRFSPDGKSVYFLSGRSGSNQLWRTDITASHAGAAPVQVTHLPLDIGSYRIAPDGRTLVVSLAVFPDCDTPACTKRRLDEGAARKASGTLYDHLFVRHWDEWADGTRQQLWALPLDAGGLARDDARPLMRGFDGDTPSKPFGDDADYAIAPDGATLVFSARIAGRTEPWSTNFDLFQVRLDGSAPPRDITAANPAWDAAPLFSPDGRTLAYKAMRRPGFEADRFGIMLRDVATGATHELAPRWDRSADAMRWSADGRTLYVTAADMGHQVLFALDVATGTPTPLTQDGHVSELDVAGSTLVYARDSLAGPTELYRLAPTPQALTHADAAQLAGIALAPYRQFAFAGWNGETVHGYVMPPANAKPGEKAPVAFLVHGGPQGSFGDSWSYRWNPQTYAAAGYAAVFIDFHGSTGYGQGFTDAISGHWGDRPLADLKAGWAAALAQFPALDASRACALGASYGGYMIYWMAGNWSAPWRCLVDHDGVFDDRMMGYSTEELWFSEWENGHATPWEKPANYERFNPVDHVADWRTPMLVIHSARDYRIPLEQGLAAFTALQRKGVPSEFLTFADENHWVLKPQNSELWQQTVLAWLARWTKD